MGEHSLKAADIAGDERRSETRGATVFRPVLIETEDFAGFCLVRNLSPHGMRAKVYTSFAADQPLVVRFASNTIVQGRLIWCDGEHIGVGFEQGIDVTEVLETLSRKELDGRLNRPLRLPISATAELIIEGRSLRAEVQDISQRGIKVLTSYVRPEEEVVIRLEGLEQRKAIVRWTQTGMAGLNFIRPLSFDELARWVVQRQLLDGVDATPEKAFNDAVPLVARGTRR